MEKEFKFESGRVSVSEKIRELCSDKDAVILAHYYVDDEIQDIADYVGDSFYLASVVKNIPNKLIVFCGVTFMGESACIINPDKKILIPDISAICPMALMTDKEEIAAVRESYEDLAVVCYINSSAETKALCDICVTSSNAFKIVKALPQKNIYMIPDGNLARRIAAELPEKNIIPGKGYCYVHNSITASDVIEAKLDYPNSLVLTHPECRSEVCEISDYVGSTGGIIKFAAESDCDEFIVCTESGVLHRLNIQNPEKNFHFIEKEVCSNMRKLSMESIYRCLLNEAPVAEIDIEIGRQAASALNRMLESAGA
ncbi:MAG: quinolinate synthase NadA [Anaerovoracaceae bacterium]